ncbi:hypothetical protein ACFTY8_48540 [Streptomyces mirabilis]|uniref:hypothetical protein n=1 Tax=Streptomyces mirabilis TaxID=68239 RepID=UPI003644CA28
MGQAGQGIGASGVFSRDDGAARDSGQTSCLAELLFRVGDLKRWARDRSCAASRSTGLE